MAPPSVDANSNSVEEHVNETELNGLLNNTKGIIQLQLKIGLILDISEITIASTSVSNPTPPTPEPPTTPPTTSSSVVYPQKLNGSFAFTKGSEKF